MPATYKINWSDLESKVQDVFPIPPVLEKIVRAVNDNDASAASLENVFKLEPALTLKLLTLANSAYFGMPGKITNIRSAITLLGLNLIKSLAIHASVNEFFRFGTNVPSFSGYELWKHSVGVAVCAKMIARRFQLGNAEDFFTLGILHDVGLILEYQFYREAFITIVSRMHERNGGLPAIEREVLGLDHAELAKRLFGKWQIPESLTQALGYHHDPLAAPEPIRAPASGLYLADQLVRQIGFGFGSPADPLLPEVLAPWSITPDVLEDLRHEFDQQISEMTLFLQ
jgi:HD-like signal output (HDOD) protein